MGRYAPSDDSSYTEGMVTPSPKMPITGVFGLGRVEIITESRTFIVPAQTLRVRMFGAGGSAPLAGSTAPGGGGGFSIKTLTGLVVGSSVTITIGVAASQASGGTTSFGSVFSATGGTAGTGSTPGVGGVGIGGDFNARGGSPLKGQGGGGVGSLFGRGGIGSGNGAGSPSSGGNGIGGKGGDASSVTGCNGTVLHEFLIDMLGTGGGGAGGPYAGHGANGGGGGCYSGSSGTPGGDGGWPGGGGGASGSTTQGGNQGADGGMVIEW